MPAVWLGVVLPDETTEGLPAMSQRLLGRTKRRREMTKAEIEFASNDAYTASRPIRKYGVSTGVACWFCGNPELISLGFQNRAPYTPGGRKGYHHKERFLCPNCRRCSVRKIRVGQERRRRIDYVIFRIAQNGELEIAPYATIKRASTVEELEALEAKLKAEGLIEDYPQPEED